MENPSTGNEPLTRHQRRQLAREQRKHGQVVNQRKGTAKKWLVWVIILAAVGGIGYGLVAVSNVGSNAPTIAVAEAVAEDWTRGPATAKVTLIEYSDLQCPACRSYEPYLTQLLADHPNDVRLVYRHFPLRSIHPNAEEASRWAEAAGLQNKFWEFHDALFTKQDEWSGMPNPTPKFEEYAKDLALDVDTMKSDATSQAVRDRVSLHARTAEKAGVSSTPTFYLNGTRMTGLSGFDDFVNQVKEAVGK